MTTLYHYVHCPFCVRVRMAFGHLKLPYKSQVLPYSDEQTPLSLMSKKMLPIAQFSDSTMNESLEIIRKADHSNELSIELLNTHLVKIEDLLSRLGSPIHNLVMPYWIYTQEFDQESREYFLRKKELKRGPFDKLMTKSPDFLAQLQPLLAEVEGLLSPFAYEQKKLTILDIMLSSHLWGLYVYPEFQFTPKLHSYLQKVKELCSFNYHEDYWAKR